MASEKKKVFLIQSGMDFLFLRNLSHLISEKDMFLCPSSLWALCCQRRQRSDVKSQRYRPQGKNMLSSSSWGGGWRRKEQGDNLGGRDSKQLYHFGRKFKLEAKLLLSQLLCLRMSSGRLIVSHSSRLHFTNPLPSHSLGSTNSRSPSLTLGR